ncbi:MAG TPA: RDD family protein [Vulgatibacter sp.]
MYCTACGRFAGGAARCAACGEAFGPPEGGLRPPALSIDLPVEHERTLVPGRGRALGSEVLLDRRAVPRSESDWWDGSTSHPHAELGAHAILGEPVDAGVDPIDLELGTMLAKGGSDEPVDEAPAPRWEAGLSLRRIGSWAVDGALLALACGAILLLGTGTPGVVVSMAPGRVLGGSPPGGMLVGPALIGLIAFVYFTLCWSLGGRTLGAHLAGVRTVDRESGEALPIGRAALRAMLAIAGTLAFLAGPLWALVDPDGEALHDKLAGSSTVSG